MADYSFGLKTLLKVTNEDEDIDASGKFVIPNHVTGITLNEVHTHMREIKIES